MCAKFRSRRAASRCCPRCMLPERIHRGFLVLASNLNFEALLRRHSQPHCFLKVYSPTACNALTYKLLAFDGECRTKSCECRTLHSISGVAFILLRLLACQQEELDLTRLMKLASFGALVHGSTGHFFYNFLDSKMPGTTALTVVKKVFIDQVSRPANPYSLAQLPSSQFPRPLPVLCLTNSTHPV